jgi:hypothetical protein
MIIRPILMAQWISFACYGTPMIIAECVFWAKRRQNNNSVVSGCFDGAWCFNNVDCGAGCNHYYLDTIDFSCV